MSSQETAFASETGGVEAWDPGPLHLEVHGHPGQLEAGLGGTESEEEQRFRGFVTVAVQSWLLIGFTFLMVPQVSYRKAGQINATVRAFTLSLKPPPVNLARRGGGTR